MKKIDRVLIEMYWTLNLEDIPEGMASVLIGRFDRNYWEALKRYNHVIIEQDITGFMHSRLLLNENEWN